MSTQEQAEGPGDELLAAVIASYRESSRLQQAVLDNVRNMADQAFPKTEDGVQALTQGESLVFWALSQQLEVMRSQLNQLEQLNLTILKYLMECRLECSASPSA